MRNAKKCRQHANTPSNEKIRVITKNYHVTSQTAYHIAQLAMMGNTSEGRIIDKLVRAHKASLDYTEGSVIDQCSSSS